MNRLKIKSTKIKRDWNAISLNCEEAGFKSYFDALFKLNKYATLRFLVLLNGNKIYDLHSFKNVNSDAELINHLEQINLFFANNLTYNDEEAVVFLENYSFIIKKMFLTGTEDPIIRDNVVKDRTDYNSVFSLVGSFFGQDSNDSIGNMQSFVKYRIEKIKQEEKIKNDHEKPANLIGNLDFEKMDVTKSSNAKQKQKKIDPSFESIFFKPRIIGDLDSYLLWEDNSSYINPEGFWIRKKSELMGYVDALIFLSIIKKKSWALTGRLFSSYYNLEIDQSTWRDDSEECYDRVKAKNNFIDEIELLKRNFEQKAANIL